MNSNFKKESGQVLVEHVALIVCVITALTIFYPQVRNYMSGRWHTAAEAISYGMIYQGTGDSCSYNSKYGFWHKSNCYETNNCDAPCFTSIPPASTNPFFPYNPFGQSFPDPPDACKLCLQGCTDGC